jgi:amino acid transporter
VELIGPSRGLSSTPQTSGARHAAGTGAVSGGSLGVASGTPRPIGPWAFTAVAVVSFGGPLALAALIGPSIAGQASASSGLAMLAAAVVFAAPLAIWLRYARYVNSSGGLYAFVEAAAGRRVALVQATIWIVSYVLYVVYTTVQIVYDLLPNVLPGERRYQTLLELGIPIALAAVMIAGRRTALIVMGLMAVGQLILAGILDGVTLAHVSTPASSFGTHAPTGPLVKSSVQTSLLYICGSLPLFLGGELAHPVRTIRRGLVGSYLVTAVVVILAVAPLAAAPGLMHTEIPGVSLAAQFSGPALAHTIGIGIAVSVAGVMLAEYLALSRVVHAVSSWRLRPITVAIGAVLVAAAPLSLIDPQGFYSALIKPSLIALWLSQLIVFAVYPRFAAQHGQRALPAWTLSAIASAFAVYGLWISVQHATS